MIRSSRIATLGIALVVAAMSTAQASPRDREKADPILTLQTPTAPVAAMVDSVFTLDALDMRFTKKGPSDVASFEQVQVSGRTQKAVQRSAFDHALKQTFSARNHSPDTFAGSMLDALLDFAGPDTVAEVAKSYRPKPEQYRILLRAISARTPQNTQSPGDTPTG